MLRGGRFFRGHSVVVLFRCTRQLSCWKWAEGCSRPKLHINGAELSWLQLWLNSEAGPIPVWRIPTSV